MRKKVVSFALLAGIFGFNLTSFGQNSTVTEKGINLSEENSTSIEVSIAQPLESASSIIEDQINEFAQKKGITYGEPLAGNKIFEYSIKELNINEPNFERKRILAFEKAFIDAQKKIAFALSQEILTKTIAEYFHDESTGIPKKVDNWKVIKNKVLALTEATLNKMLEKLGVDPSRLGQLSLEEKRKIFLDSIRREVLRKTVEELSGTAIVQTFEGVNKDGSYAVGVIVMYSPKLKQVAYDILNGKEPSFIKLSKGKNLREYLPKTPKGWMASWGVRVVWDSEGYPALISFGQWAYPYTKNPQRRSRLIEGAKRRAIMLADAYIADFLDSKIVALETGNLGGDIVENIVETPSDEWKENIDSLVDKYYSKVKRTSRVKVSGIGTLAVKTLKTKIGDRYFYIVIAARSWTYRSSQLAQQLRNWKPQKKETSPSTQEVKKEYQREIISGPETTDIYDW
jgi:hypothetical protein